jgi:hypothetical protein
LLDCRLDSASRRQAAAAIVLKGGNDEARRQRLALHVGRSTCSCAAHARRGRDLRLTWPNMKLGERRRF